jgi:hypothetical protein
MVVIFGRARPPRPALVLLFLAATAAGCGEPRGDISGKVLFDGKPLTVGSNKVSFHAADGRVIHCTVEPDGSYRLKGVPVGDGKFTVESLPPPPMLPAAPGKDGKMELIGEKGDPSAGKAANLPTRYKDPKQSGLTYTVGKGSQTFDLELKP